jgi:serine/threonine-protein kinase
MAQKPPAGKEQKTAILDAPSTGQASGMGSSLPPPPAPPGPGGGAPAQPSSSAKTMMLESPAAAAPPPVQRGGSPAVPTMMRQRPAELPPMRRPRAAWGRWVAGPLLAVGVAAGTAALANVIMPAQPKGPPPKPMGRLRLGSNPVGASLLIDGKIYPHFTPTTYEGEVGATLHVTFKLDGYAPKEADVVVGEGEHPFAAKLEPLPKPAPAPEPPPAPAPAPPPAHVHHEHAPKEPPVAAGTTMVSIFVRPWAIVYLDGTKLRQTPVVNFAVPSGKHTIELVNEGKNRREKIPVVLKPDEPQEIKRDWDQ